MCFASLLEGVVSENFRFFSLLDDLFPCNQDIFNGFSSKPCSNSIAMSFKQLKRKQIDDWIIEENRKIKKH